MESVALCQGTGGRYVEPDNGWGGMMGHNGWEEPCEICGGQHLSPWEREEDRRIADRVALWAARRKRLRRLIWRTSSTESA